MAFSLFKKKKEVIDFTSTNSEGIPTEGYMKRKGITSPAPSSAVPSTAANTGSGGGFFGSFFGGGSSPSAETTAPAPASTQTAQTDFWGNPVNNANSSSDNNSDSQISDILYRLSRLTDRLELIERKMDRLERKTGISGSE